MKKRKIPLRMCVGCRTMKPKKELMRIVRGPENEVCIDSRGKAPGRGAYLCKNIECLDKAIKSKAIDKALSISIDEEIYNKVKVELARYELKK